MNEDRFSGRGRIYAQYRPTYADSFIEYLYTEVDLNADSVIADIGSGTGILTGLLLRRGGGTIYGVEPNDDMRRIAENDLSRHVNYISANAAAENTNLLEGSVDFITVAQAFHWFDRKKFKAECRRILRPGGKVILVWNRKDNSWPLIQELDAIHQTFCPDYTGFSGGLRVERLDSVSDFFRAGIVEQRMFQNDMHLDSERFIGNCLSGSYAPHERAENYLPYITTLNRLFEKYQNAGVLCLPNQTWSYVGQV